MNLFTFCTETFKEAAGRRLTSLEVHDIICMIGDIVVVGGVRRSALISLSNLTDLRMREAKTGNWYAKVEDGGKPWRGLANNSVAYTEKPDVKTFMEEWLSLVKSGSGERGVFNRVAAQDQASRWGLRDRHTDYGCNPCSEIILRNKQFCNLTEVVVRAEDTFEQLKRKVELATILGTYQATLSNFNFLSEEWKKNTEEERLLGVSLTGIMDHYYLNGSYKKDNGWDSIEVTLQALRNHARKTNEKYAKQFDIEPSTAITCVKPSGTVSQLVDSASGIHTRYSPYYIRRTQLDKKDPVRDFLIEKGFPIVDYEAKKHTTSVLSYPTKAPEGALVVGDLTSIEQLEIWLIYQEHWCEHKPSCTVYVKEHEWFEVGAWVYKHFDKVSGVSFLPYSDHIYVQPPYEPISKEKYEELLAAIPPAPNWEEVIEEKDNTIGSQELACTGPEGCEL
jgi:ribonucleoside-diphosphate reductase alpha chain